MNYALFGWMIVGFLLLGCAENVPTAEGIQPQEAEITEEASEPSCTTDDDCGGKQCIGGICQQISDPVDTCEATCRITGVTIETSDGQTLELVPGKGSYTAAGALQWRIESSPKHCKGEARIPIEITRYNYGEKLDQEIITLAEGESSRVITHPTITSVAFMLTVNYIAELCS